MNVLLIIAHPNPNSFNFALLDAVEKGLTSAGHEVRIHNLYRIKFDPVLSGKALADLQNGIVSDDVLEEQKLLKWADGLVFIYPLWWFERPAILKGWFDRVLTYGFAFHYDENGLQGLLKHQKALMLITAGSTEKEYSAMDVSADDLLRSMTKGTLAFCGVKNISGRVLFSIPTMSDAQREELLRLVEGIAAEF